MQTRMCDLNGVPLADAGSFVSDAEVKEVFGRWGVNVK